MIGKSEETPWRYDFDCRTCAQIHAINGANYCLPIRNGEDPIHADADRVLRCDKYTPMNYSLFMEET